MFLLFPVELLVFCVSFAGVLHDLGKFVPCPQVALQMLCLGLPRRLIITLGILFSCV